jgi:hypothetical protein
MLAAHYSQTNGVFQFQIKNATGTEQFWTIDLKKDATVYKGTAQSKSDVTIIVSGTSLFSSPATPRSTMSDPFYLQMTHSPT